MVGCWRHRCLHFASVVCISRLSARAVNTTLYTTLDIHCRDRPHECDGGIRHVDVSAGCVEQRAAYGWLKRCRMIRCGSAMNVPGSSVYRIHEIRHCFLGECDVILSWISARRTFATLHLIARSVCMLLSCLHVGLTVLTTQHYVTL